MPKFETRVIEFLNASFAKAARGGSIVGENEIQLLRKDMPPLVVDANTSLAEVEEVNNQSDDSDYDDTLWDWMQADEDDVDDIL